MLALRGSEWVKRRGPSVGNAALAAGGNDERRAGTRARRRERESQGRVSGVPRDVEGTREPFGTRCRRNASSPDAVGGEGDVLRPARDHPWSGSIRLRVPRK